MGFSGRLLTTSGIAPITVNSYELGWRLNQDTGLNLGLTGFYNNSDKVVQFNSNRSVNVVDTDQRVYGAEATVSYPFMENSLYTTNFTEHLSYQGSAFLKLPKFP